MAHNNDGGSMPGNAHRRSHDGTASESVFLDPSGRRWRWLKITLVVVAAAVALATATALPRIQTAPALEPGVEHRSLAGAVDDAPVIGRGPLLRVVEVVDTSHGPTVRDPYTGDDIRHLTADERKAVVGHGYAIERFGYRTAAERTISLTFDDGPSAEFTPILLDLLARENVPATFFVTGAAVAAHPELVERMAAEGHALGNHTFSHVDVSRVDERRVREELLTTDHVLRAVSGTYTKMFRLPYSGNDRRSVDEDAVGIARAQQLGYVATGFDFDTNDWKYSGDTGPRGPMPMPQLDGRNITMLLHDAGGDRTRTLQYVERLIRRARAAGYTFHTMPQVDPSLARDVGPVDPTIWDRTAFWAARVLTVWPDQLVHGLFALAVVSVLVGGLVSVILAIVRRVRRGRVEPPPDREALSVSVLIAAYNEEAVIAQTLAALGRSEHPILEFLVIDDGSTDRTAQIVRQMSEQDPRIRLIRQENGGKSTALNRGTAHARGDIVVTLDADTQFTPTTVSNLVRQFATDPDGRLGAVAGVVKVGNRNNLLTRWQAVEYITQIGIERAAQDALGAVMIVPGACAAWRKSALREAGGYSEATLAEDFDLTLTLHRLRYRVTQDDEAVAYTEAPEGLAALLKQRTRWVYGSLQALWKHHTLLFNPTHGWLGMVLVPYTALSIIVPLLFLPIVYALAIVAVQAHGAQVVLVYLGLFTLAQFIVAAVGVVLMREQPSHLLMIPVYRLIYEPMRAYLLYKSVYTALRGTRLDWNKLLRTGTVALEDGPGLTLPTMTPIVASDAVAGSPTAMQGRERRDTGWLWGAVQAYDQQRTSERLGARNPVRAQREQTQLSMPDTADPGWLWEALREHDERELERRHNRAAYRSAA